MEADRPGCRRIRARRFGKDGQVGFRLVVVAGHHAIAGRLDDRAKHVLHPRIVRRQTADRLLCRSRRRCGEIGEEPVRVDDLGRLPGDQGHGRNLPGEVGDQVIAENGEVDDLRNAANLARHR